MPFIAARACCSIQSSVSSALLAPGAGGCRTTGDSLTAGAVVAALFVSPSPGDVEPDLLDDQQEVVGHEYVPTTPEGSDGEKAEVSHWSSHDREKRRKLHGRKKKEKKERLFGRKACL